MKFFGNVTKLEAAIEAADGVLNAALAKANVLTVSIDGKAVAVADAPLADKARALIALNPVGESQATVNELHVTNTGLAARLEGVSGERDTALASLGALQLDKSNLTTRAEAAEASVQTLTAEKGQLGVQLKAAQSEFERVSREHAGFNTELSKACIAVGCLQLTDASGAALPLAAGEAVKLEAANKLSVSDKLKAYQAGLNMAITATGLNVASLPGAPLKFTATPAAGILAQHKAITDPMAKAQHYAKNKEAIDQAYRDLNSK